MKRHFVIVMAFAILALALLPASAWAQLNPPVSAAGCDNPTYNPIPVSQSIQLCNDPLADGLFTEDGVIGYQYIFDIFTTSGCCGDFHIGGTDGPLGPAGTFKANESAWWRQSTGNPDTKGIWQRWGNQSVHDGIVGTGNSHNFFGFGGSSQVNTTTPVWSEVDNAAVGDTTTDVWDTAVTFNPVTDLFSVGGTSVVGNPIPWAADNPWHKPSEYGFSSEWFLPGAAFGSTGLQDDEGVAWRSWTTVFVGGALALQHTVRIVAPYEPGSINWGGDINGSGGVITGPNGAPVPQITCVIGDANCDGYVDIGGDILPGFSNFTGPGSFGKTRVQGDVEGSATGATTNLDPHDGDVDVSDLLTMFGNFTGPPPDEGGLGGPAEVGDPSIPDLIYDAATGEVTLDVDGSGIIGYVLKNGAGTFVPGNHTPILGGVTTSLAGELSEAALSSPGGANSIGFVFPTGMDLAALTAYLTTNEVSRSLGAPIVPFDLVVLTTGPPVPEPATLVISVLGLVGMGFVAYRRRRSA